MFEPVNMIQLDNNAVMMCDFCLSCDDSTRCISCNVAGDTR